MISKVIKKESTYEQNNDYKKQEPNTTCHIQANQQQIRILLWIRIWYALMNNKKAYSKRQWLKGNFFRRYLKFVEWF